MVLQGQLVGTDRVRTLPCDLGNTIRLHRVVGEGAASTIYLASSHKRAGDLVVKLALRAKNDRGYDWRYWSEEACLASMETERKIYARLKSPYILGAILDLSPEDDYICLEGARCSLQTLHENWSKLHEPSDLYWAHVAEPLPGKSQDVLKMHTSAPAEYSRAEFSIGDDLLFSIASQWLSGLLYLFHEAKVVNRDIKIGNLLLMPDSRWCISDFGLAGEYTAEEARLDLQRFGSSIWLLVTGQMPYHHFLSRRAMKRLLEADSTTNGKLKSFVLACYDLSAGDLAAHSWLTSADWKVASVGDEPRRLE